MAALCRGSSMQGAPTVRSILCSRFPICTSSSHATHLLSDVLRGTVHGPRESGVRLPGADPHPHVINVNANRRRHRDVPHRGSSMLGQIVTHLSLAPSSPLSSTKREFSSSVGESCMFRASSPSPSSTTSMPRLELAAPLRCRLPEKETQESVENPKRLSQVLAFKVSLYESLFSAGVTWKAPTEQRISRTPGRTLSPPRRGHRLLIPAPRLYDRRDRRVSRILSRCSAVVDRTCRIPLLSAKAWQVIAFWSHIPDAPCMVISRHAAL